MQHIGHYKIGFVYHIAVSVGDSIPLGYIFQTRVHRPVTLAFIYLSVKIRLHQDGLHMRMFLFQIPLYGSGYAV